MELMHSHRWDRPLPDWRAAIVSGFVAGAVVMVLELLWSTLVNDGNPWQTVHMVAAIVMGQDVLQPLDFSLPVVVVALVTHYVLGIVFGLILAGIVAPYHFDARMSTVLATGAIFGVVLYLVNFYGMAHIFDWFVAMRGVETCVAHVIFGMVAAAAYLKLEKLEH